MLLPPPQAFLGDNERGRNGEHGNELEAQAEADGKEKIRERGVMGRLHGGNIFGGAHFGGAYDRREFHLRSKMGWA